MSQFNEPVIPKQAAATITSAAIPATNMVSCSIQVNTTGSAAAVCKLQASNDHPVASSAVPTNWSDISGATVTVSAAGAVIIPKTDTCYEYIRVVYTNTGTGTVEVRLKALVYG